MTLDFIILGAIVLSVLIGFVRGFIPEILAVITWIAAIWAGWHVPYMAIQLVDGRLGSEVVELWVSRFIVFVIVLIVGNFIGQLLALAIDKARISSIDRILGMVFGLVRGLVIFGLIVVFAQQIKLQEEQWWDKSSLMPVGEGMAKVLQGLLPSELSEHMNPLPDAQNASEKSSVEST